MFMSCYNRFRNRITPLIGKIILNFHLRYPFLFLRNNPVKGGYNMFGKVVIAFNNHSRSFER